MPHNLKTYLGAAFAASVGMYVALVVTTVMFAATQTDLQGRVTDTEAAIGGLEAKYYDSIAAVSALDPAALGLVAPRTREYARAATGPVLTLVGGN